MGLKMQAASLKLLQWLESPVATGLLSAGISIGILLVGGWEPLERVAYKLLFQTRDRIHPITWDSRIAVITIDEASLNQYGRFPLSRDLYAQMLDKLLAVQPAAVGFDVLLVESTVHDSAFANSIALSGNVVLAVASDSTGNALEVTSTLRDPAKGSFLLGHVKHTLDSDGMSRVAKLYEGEFPMLGVALLQMAQTTLDNTLGTAGAQTSFATDFQPSAALNQRPVWINWPGSVQPKLAQTEGLTTISFADVLSDQADLSQLQNKIVLVGVTATGLDSLRTPFYSEIPTSGVYLHAAVIDNILNDRFLHRWTGWATAALLLMIGVGTSLGLKRLEPRLRLVIFLAWAPAWFAIAYGGFVQQYWLPVGAPIATGLLSALALQLVEQRERQSLMDLFALNASPELADLLWHNKTDILQKGQIQPQEMTATVLFSDIRGFTSITEHLPSEVLLPWLNRYFEVMTDCIMTQGGVVDKYIGDAIMAVFGVPIPRRTPEAIQQDAIAAIEASFMMYQRLTLLNQEFAAEGLPTIQFGVGLHTGKVIGGTVGSQRRLSYSLFGDTVNVSSRLQDMTKTLVADAAYPILVSDETYRYICDRYPGQTKGELQLRGRLGLTPIYTVEPKA